MTLHSRADGLEHAVPRHNEPEAFAVACEPELAAAPLHEHGVCYLPECSKPFDPPRAWSRYCSPACERRGKQEFRKWGHKLAEAMLCHRVGKYDKSDPAIQARTRAARRYVTHVQSAWLADRKDRMEVSHAGG